MDTVQVILSTLVIQAGAEYYISERTSKWREAVGKCNMALPDLHPTKEGFKVDIDYDWSNGDVWLGYFMKMAVFDYIGCVKLDGQNFSRLGRSVSPGLCYTFCSENEMIGVSIDKCTCVDTFENNSRHEINCTTSCGPSNEGVACGGVGYMSVYKVNKNDFSVSTSEREKKCLSFEQYVTRVFKWKQCSQYHFVACENDLIVQDNHPWLDSMNECFKRGSLPKSYQALTEINSRINPFWSGVISSDVVYNYTEWNGNLQGVRFGFMSVNQRVYFTDTDEPRFVLCNSNTTPLDASSTNPTTNTPVKIDITTSRRAYPERENSTTVTKNTTSLQLPHTNTKGVGVSVIIGVSVSACVVIIAVVAALIILKRRGKLLNLQCSSEQDVVINDKVDKTSTVIKDSTSETVNTEQDHYTDLSQTEYINDSHTYDGLELSNSDHNAFGHERNLSLENGNIYYNDIISEKT